jgi:hypothetical protein
MFEFRSLGVPALVLYTFGCLADLEGLRLTFGKKRLSKAAPLC